MRLVPGLCVSFLLLLLAAPYTLPAQEEGAISATIIPDDSMFVYGGMVFTLIVRNNSEDTILFLDTMSDMYVRLDNGKGRVYVSKRFWRLIVDTIPIAPLHTFRSRFELTTLGVAVTASDNFGWGPFFEPDIYDMHDTLMYSSPDSKNEIKRCIIHQTVHINETSRKDKELLEAYRAAQNRMMSFFYGMEFAGASSTSAFSAGLRDYATFADTCSNKWHRRRFLQAYIEIAVEQILTMGMGYFIPDDADAFKADIKKRLEYFIVSYPDMPFARFCAMHLRLHDPEPEFIDKLKQQGIFQRLLPYLTSKTVSYQEGDILR